jgi:hypothetical protein
MTTYLSGYNLDRIKGLTNINEATLEQLAIIYFEWGKKAHHTYMIDNSMYLGYKVKQDSIVNLYMKLSENKSRDKCVAEMRDMLKLGKLV